MRKAVITTAGLGTRLLLATKEMPKEMLPLFCLSQSGNLLLKPVLQLVFEQLYDLGFREFCFVVGRGKRSIEDYFTPDYNYIELLRRRNKIELVRDLEEFYRKVEESIIFWVNQPEPRGFGHAILMAESFIGHEPFLVCAGDTYIISRSGSPIKYLLDQYAFRKPQAMLLLKEVHGYQKMYGCAVAREIEKEILRVEYVVEKPEKPPSNLAIMPIYVFDPVIFEALKQIGPGVGGEIQLTDAIQKLIEWGMRVEAIKLREDDIRLDVGTPETYWEALKISYLQFGGKGAYYE